MKKILYICLGLSLTACSSSQWDTVETPDEASVYQMLQTESLSERSNLFLTQKDSIDLPKSVRPCCAFGNEQSVELASVKIPLFHLPNTVDIESIGPHIYGAGQFDSRRAQGKKLPQIENNGMLYTVRGGFIDMAHVRDTADNTIGLFYKIYPQLGQAFTIELSPELGARQIEFKAFDTSGLNARDRKHMAIMLAAFYAFKMAEGHEISQWHGYESFPLFSELVSAYSIEDLYSNMLGAKLAAKLLTDDLASSFDDYNQNMTVWIHSALNVLGPYEKDQTAEIFKQIDGLWWDSSTPIPNKYMVLKRNYNLTATQTPALVDLNDLPLDKAADLRSLIASDVKPQRLALADQSAGILFSDISKMTMAIDKKYQASFSHIPSSLYPNDVIDAQNYDQIARYDETFDKNEYQQWVKDHKSK
ncbi:MAG: DUF4056 domain-containing protein [Vibrio sp.]